MKRKFSFLFALIIVMQMVSIPAFASDTDSISLNTEIQNELTSAEAILGGPCKMLSQGTEQVGDYIVEKRLYVLDDAEATASSGQCGAISADLWHRIGSDDWDIKVLLSAYFYYNGESVICNRDETDVWAVDPDNNVLDYDLFPTIIYSDGGSTAKVRCTYSISFSGGQEVEISNTKLNVTCTNKGVLGYKNTEHTYI